MTWAAAEKRLLELAQAPSPLPATPEDEVLVRFGLLAGRELTSLGERYYMARFVHEDTTETAVLTAAAMKQYPTVNAFCEALWRAAELPKRGAMNLLRRLERGVADTELTRLLEQMGRADLIVYNRRSPTIRSVYNPLELVPPAEALARERASGHVIALETPFGNLLALRDMLRSARGFIYWYEQHMPGKVLEVLYREVEVGRVNEIRLLSGPERINMDLRSDFKRFARELLHGRAIRSEWHVLSRREAANRHGRFFLSENLARNIPPLHSILKGSTDEILPSEIRPDDFERWWSHGKDIFALDLTLDSAA